MFVLVAVLPLLSWWTALTVMNASIGSGPGGSLSGINFGPSGSREAFITVNAVHQDSNGSTATSTNTLSTYYPGVLTINAPIAANNLTMSGPGTLVLGNAVNFYSNASPLVSIDNGTIRLGASTLPANSIVNLYGSSLGILPNNVAAQVEEYSYSGGPTYWTAGTFQSGTLDLYGQNLTVAQLGGFTGQGGGAYGVVTNSSTTASTLTVTNGGTTGALQGNLALVLGANAGTLILGANNTWSGGATVAAGAILQIGYGALGTDSNMPAASTFTLQGAGGQLVLDPLSASSIPARSPARAASSSPRPPMPATRRAASSRSRTPRTTTRAAPPSAAASWPSPAPRPWAAAASPSGAACSNCSPA